MAGSSPSGTSRASLLASPCTVCAIKRPRAWGERCRNVRARLFTGIVQGKATVAGLKSTDSLTSLKVEFDADRAPSRSCAACQCARLRQAVCCSPAPVHPEAHPQPNSSASVKVHAMLCLRTGELIAMDRYSAAEPGHVIAFGNPEFGAKTYQDTAPLMQVQFPEGCAQNVALGASVALNGACLTATQVDNDRLSFDVIAETLARTNLGQLHEGAHVNFERSAKVGDEIGGHHVSGHIHTTAAISDVQKHGDDVRLEFKLASSQWQKYVLPKGFVAVDGCSLTVGEVEGDSFSVYLIPETLRTTILGSKSQGSTVNIEIDAQTQAIVDTVERVVADRLQSVEHSAEHAAQVL